MLHGALSVFRFELRRTVTWSRVAIWLILVAFPIFIVSVMKYCERYFDPTLAEGPSIREVPTIRGNDGRLTQVTINHNGRVRVYEQVEVPDSNGRLTKKKVLRPTDPGTETNGQSRQPGDETPPDNPEIAAAIETADGEGAFSGEPNGSATADETSSYQEPRYPPWLWGGVLFGLIPEVITLFGLLLWITPLVHAELEGKTWVFLASRPRGRVSVLVGKYLTGVTWTLLAGLVSTTVCILIARPDDALRFWWAIMALVAFSCVSYGSMYSLFGVLFRRRAMVIAVAYTLIFEFLVSFIPAVINQLTVQYRLRNLLVTWLDWRDLMPPEAMILLGNEPAWLQMLVLCGVTVVLLVAAGVAIQRKEYVTASDV